MAIEVFPIEVLIKSNLKDSEARETLIEPLDILKVSSTARKRNERCQQNNTLRYIFGQTLNKQPKPAQTRTETE